MTNIIKLDINNLEIERFTKLLDKLQDSFYTIWEGRIVRHQSKDKNYSYKNLLLIFKSLKEQPDTDTDHLENLRAKLLKLDKPTDNSFGKRVKEFFHSIVSLLSGSHINKDEILDNYDWTIQDSDDNSGTPQQIVEEASTKTPDKPSVIMPHEVLDEKKNDEFSILEDKDHTFNDDELSEEKPSDFTDADVFNQDNFGTEKHDQTEPEIVDDAIGINEPIIPAIVSHEALPEENVDEPASKIVLQPAKKVKSKNKPHEAPGYTKWHLLGVGLITLVATVIFDRLFRSQFSGSGSTSVACPAPQGLGPHNVTYCQLRDLSDESKALFDKVDEAFLNLEKLDVTNSQLKATIIQKDLDIQDLNKMIQELSQKTHGLKDPKILELIRTALDQKDNIDAIKAGLYFVKQIAEDKTINGNKKIDDALAKNAVEFTEGVIFEFINSEDCSLQLKVFEALLPLYKKEQYVVAPKLELHTLFAGLIRDKKINDDTLWKVDTLIRNAQLPQAQIKQFILELNLLKELNEDHIKFFDALLQEHLVRKGDYQPALNTAEKAEKLRKLAILTSTLESFIGLSNVENAQKNIVQGIIQAVEKLEDIELLNNLLKLYPLSPVSQNPEPLLDTEIQTKLINLASKVIPIKAGDKFVHLHTFMAELARLKAHDARLQITQAMLVKINTVLKDKIVTNNQKTALLYEFLKGFDTLHDDIKRQLVPMANLVSKDGFEIGLDAQNLLNVLLKLQSYDAFLQIPDTLLTNYQIGTKEKIISLLEMVIKKGDLNVPVLTFEQKIYAATLNARAATKPELTQEELHRISALNKMLGLPKFKPTIDPAMTDEQKALLLAQHEAMLITKESLKAYVEKQTADAALTLIDYFANSPFENTNNRLFGSAKLLLESGARNWMGPTDEDYKKRGVALDIFARLAYEVKSEDYKEYLKGILTEAYKDSVNHKALYPKAVKLTVAILENEPTDDFITDSIKKTWVSLNKWAKQYPDEERIQAIKDYATIFKILFSNPNLHPNSSPLIECILNSDEKIDAEIATLFLEIATEYTKKGIKDFPKILLEHSSSVLNRVEKDLTATPLIKLRLYKKHMEATFITPTEADVIRFTKLFKEMPKQDQQSMDQMIDVLRTTIAQTSDKVKWPPINEILAQMKK